MWRFGFVMGHKGEKGRPGRFNYPLDFGTETGHC